MADLLDEYLERCMGTNRDVALLLDYDGTLTPITSHPDLAHLPPDTRTVLTRLTKLPNVHVAIISGRSLSNVMEMVGIDGITYAGNHGLEIRHKDGSKYVHSISPETRERMSTVLKGLKDECCQDGAWVEDKHMSLTYHFRNVPSHKRDQLVARAADLILNSGFKVGEAHCALECKPTLSWNKGAASEHILQTTYGENWMNRIKVLYVGDDITDEEAMSVLKGKGYTFRVTTSQDLTTVADKKLSGPESVLRLLRWFDNKFQTVS